MTKAELFASGIEHVRLWCGLNGVMAPAIEQSGNPALFGTCAYYRDDVIYVSVVDCAAIGKAGRAWSFPGYVVDRTPYGVLAHELGHHVEGAHGAAGGDVARGWRAETRAAPITSYCPNDNEWFAELFRLFVTNPDLLRLLRPTVFALLERRWPCRAEGRDWRAVLAFAVRQTRAAENKIAQALRVDRRSA